MKKIIGLTGGIASGKSAVSDYLAKKGYPLIDADLVAREVVEPGSEGLEQLILAFGKAICAEDGTLNRKKLGEIIFTHEEKRQLLNQILHPLIEARIQEDLEAYRQNEKAVPLFLVVPLLYETGYEKYCDQVWLVKAPYSTRVQRIMERDGADYHLAEKKIAAQAKPEVLIAKHHPYIIENKGSLAELYEEIEKALRG